MRIWCISDTHRKHGFLNIPNNVDMVIHAGDCGDAKNPAENANEVLDFLEWYNSLSHIKYKVLIAGNHDTSIWQGLVKPEEIQKNGIMYLQHEQIEIEKLRIFGSPYTPTFGTNWAFNVNRDKLNNFWQHIPDGTDILITHGPPRGILDHTESGVEWDFREDNSAKNVAVYSCGCKALLSRVKIIKPKFHIFGHIHSETNCHNAGTMTIQDYPTKFINASVVTLRQEMANNGVIIEI